MINVVGFIKMALAGTQYRNRFSSGRFLNQSPPLNRHQLCKVLILIYIKIYIDMYRTKDMRQERNN